MIATIFLSLLGAYLVCGLTFAIPFALFGVKTIDPRAAHGSRGFRMLIIPGTMALWPVLLKRWASGAKEPPEECTGPSPRRAEGSHAVILPLRQRHRRIFVVLAMILPITFLVGILARKPATAITALSAGLAASTPVFAATEWNRSDLFAKAPISVRLLREKTGAGNFAIEFFAAKDFVKPDLIAYWVAGSPSLTNAVPDDARLLGGFDSAAILPLPRDAETATGELILYSLADQEIVEVSKPFSLSKP